MESQPSQPKPGTRGRYNHVQNCRAAVLITIHSCDYPGLAFIYAGGRGGLGMRIALLLVNQTRQNSHSEFTHLHQSSQRRMTFDRSVPLLASLAQSEPTESQNRLCSFGVCFVRGSGSGFRCRSVVSVKKQEKTWFPNDSILGIFSDYIAP